MNRIVHISSRMLALCACVGALAAPAATAAPEQATTKERSAPAAKSEPTASERRAAMSEFEREKLDSSAFDDTKGKAGSDSKEGSSGSGAGSIVRAILGFIVVIGSVYGVHWLLKRWGSSRIQGVAGRTGVIDVVATTSLAQGRALHLVRVGDELVLVGATEQSITRIGDVDASLIGASAGNAGNGEFQSMLAGAMYGQQPGVPAGMGGASSARVPFIKRFLDNLRMTTAR